MAIAHPIQKHREKRYPAVPREWLSPLHPPYGVVRVHATRAGDAIQSAAQQ